MPYTLPHLKDFQKIQASLHERYTEARQNRDKARYLSAFLPETTNPDRKNDITFIQTICQHVEAHKNEYDTYDKDFETANYAIVIAPFLKKAMTGAFMLTLSEIHNSYKILTPCSALEDVILEIFSLKSFEEIPAQELIDNLKALERYLTKTQHLKKENDASWHPSMTDTALFKQLSDTITRVNTLNDDKKISTFNFFGFFASSSSSTANATASTSTPTAP